MGLVPDIISVILGYLLGSIPSAYIVGRLVGKIDVREEGDGRISASVVHRKLGLLPFLLVVVMDVVKGAIAVIIAGLLTDSLIVVLLSGFAAVLGHNWSVFLKFKGGVGRHSDLWSPRNAGMVADVDCSCSGRDTFLYYKKIRPGHRGFDWYHHRYSFSPVFAVERPSYFGALSLSAYIVNGAETNSNQNSANQVVTRCLLGRILFRRVQRLH